MSVPGIVPGSSDGRSEEGSRHERATREYRESGRFWFQNKSIAGHIAMWAVRQSPYNVPDNLDRVLDAFLTGSRSLFDEDGLASLSRADIEEILERHLLSQPEVQLWNVRKADPDNTNPLFVDPWTRISPDHDFIDLNALVMNVCRTLIDEAVEDKLFDDRLEAIIRRVASLAEG